MTKLASLRCVGLIAKTGERCGNPAKPGSRRCGLHTAIPPERVRCQHRWGNGKRCEGKVAKSRIGVGNLCNTHRRPCANPGCPTGTLVAVIDGLCVPCAAALAREAAAAAKPRPMTAREKWEQTFGGLPRCVEMSTETGEPCQGNALRDTGRCVKHQNIPADEFRCTFHWESGQRCTRRWQTKGDHRCRFHSTNPGKTGRPVKGEAPVHRPCPECGNPSKGVFGCAAHSPRCEGTTGKGERCSRSATVKVGGVSFCKSHASRAVTPPPAPPAGVTARCGVPSGADGDPCGLPVAVEGVPCHRHATLPDGQERCLHVYGSGARCPSRSRKAHGHGHGTMCAVHAVACSAPGCDANVSDTVRQLCRAHAPRCAATVPGGHLCGLPANPGSEFCGQHQTVTGGPRCAWLYGNGERCRNALPAGSEGGTVWRDLCSHHQVPCGHPECEKVTAFADGLCNRHRPRCAHGGCQRAALAGDLCWQHRRIVEDGTCALLTRFGEPCGNPAAVDTLTDGVICVAHHAKMPADELRCAHEYGTGQRCALSAQDGTLFCSPHGPAHTTGCAWVKPDGAVCGKPACPRPGEVQPTCEVHRRIPADGERCVEMVGGGQRCPGARLAGADRCNEHAAVVRCGVLTPRGEPCGQRVIVRVEGESVCGLHRVLPPEGQRCSAQVAEGVLCPGVREFRRDFCWVHASEQPVCVAVDDRGVRCRQYAPSGFDLCDKHDGWQPGQPFDRPDEYEQFFLKPRLGLVWELLDALASDAGALSDPDATMVPGITGSGENGMSGLDDLIDQDPYDLTGARRTYVEFVEDGMPEEDALRAARLISRRYSQNTVKNLTSSLRPYLEWCQANACVPVPASRTTIMRFLTYLTTRGRLWDGEPLSQTTMQQFRQAITKAHTVAGEPNPFDKHPALVSLLKGYDRVYSKPQVQAHAVRLDELAALVAAALDGGTVSLRDLVIASVVADPEVGLTLGDAAQRWTWENTGFNPGAATKVTIWKGRATSPTRHDLTVPNRTADVLASGQDFPAGEMPVEVRLCGTASLQALAAERTAKGLPLSGPVLCKDDGTALSKPGVVKVIATAAKKCGLGYSPTYTFDDRLRLVEALTEPDLIGLRDAALMLLSWWASLRRSELSALNVGDIGKDARGRGLVVLVRKSKTDVNGQFVPVPYVRDSKGRPLPTDVAHALHRWLDAYARHLGREITESDPLFINVMGQKGERLGTQGISDVITRYAAAAGVQAELGERISSHGFRAGYATEWLASGRAAEPLAKRQRRSSTQSLLGYFRLADPFEDSLAFTFESPDEAFAAFEMQKLNAQTRREGL